MSHPEGDPSDDSVLHYVLVLGDRPAIAILTCSPGHRFRSDDQMFQGREDILTTGLYSCLHDKEWDVVGISHTLLHHNPTLGPDDPRFFARLDELDYVELHGNSFIYIALDGNPASLSAESGGEEENDESRIYAGDHGDFAFFFITTCVAESDIERFWGSGCDRVAVELIL